MIHKKEIDNYDGDLNQLVDDIGDLHYKTLTKFLFDLSLKIKNDSIKDRKNNRKKLSVFLSESSLSLHDAGNHMKNAWEISKPFMK